MPKPFKVLVCGGRDYEDFDTVNRVLDEVNDDSPITHLIEGGALGADALAAFWADEHDVHSVTVKAIWYPKRTKGALFKGAGPVRNNIMAELAPDLVVAFPGGTGTENMINLAMDRGIPYRRVP